MHPYNLLAGFEKSGTVAAPPGEQFFYTLAIRGVSSTDTRLYNHQLQPMGYLMNL